MKKVPRGKVDPIWLLGKNHSCYFDIAYNVSKRGSGLYKV